MPLPCFERVIAARRPVKSADAAVPGGSAAPVVRYVLPGFGVAYLDLNFAGKVGDFIGKVTGVLGNAIFKLNRVALWIAISRRNAALARDNAFREHLVTSGFERSATSRHECHLIFRQRYRVAARIDRRRALRPDWIRAAGSRQRLCGIGAPSSGCGGA